MMNFRGNIVLKINSSEFQQGVSQTKQYIHSMNFKVESKIILKATRRDRDQSIYIYQAIMTTFS